MKAQFIGNHLKLATERKELTQRELADETHRAKTTINGYFNSEPTPIEAMVDIAGVIDDSILSQQFSHVVFDGIPAMESEVFNQTPHTLDIIQMIESDERKASKNQAMFALTKNKTSLTEDDKAVIADYAMNFLDEVFIEIRYIISLLDQLDMSLMTAVKERIPYWKLKDYLRR